MRLKKLASSIAVFGMAGGMILGVASAAHAESATIYPYIDWSSGANTHQDTTLIGSTDPGQADNKLCLDYPMDSTTLVSGRDLDMNTPGHYSGRVNGVVVNPGTQLDEEIVLQDNSTNVPSCTGGGIDITATAATAVDPVKHSGTDTVSTSADVQNGLLATSVTYIRVTCSNQQVVSTPSGATIVATSNATNNTKSATCNANGATVDFSLKAVGIKTKPVLNTSACDDVDNVVSNTVADDASNERTVPFDNSDAAHSYSPSDAATKNLITIHECAESMTNVSGKPVATKVSVAGVGTDSISLLYTQTIGPQLWDTTRGSTCSDTKETDTVGGVPYGSRVFICKGNYGMQIPLHLTVRGVNSGTASIDPKGLLHAAPPLLISSSSMTIT